MSPGPTDCAVLSEREVRRAPSSAAVQVVAQRAPSSTARGTAEEDHEQPNDGGTTSPWKRHRRKAKPLSSGWKSLAWTTPPTEGLHAKAPALSWRQQQPTAGTAAAAAGVNIDASNTEHIVPPVDTGSATSTPRTTTLADNTGTLEHQPPQGSARRRSRGEYLEGILQSSSSSGVSRSSLPRNFQRPGMAEDLMAPSRQSIQPAKSAELRQSREDANAMTESLQPQLQTQLQPQLQPQLGPDDYAQPQRGSAPRYQDAPAPDEISKSMPNQHRRESSIDVDSNTVQAERSLSDTCIVTASDCGPKKTSNSNSNRPTILTEMKDEDAIAALVSLLGKGKGIPVMKHVGGSGGGKSRKFLKFNEDQGWLGLGGMLRPYFKTKIPVRDIDRVDSKWCCVVVHAKGRSLLRLEVDSCATADLIRVGLLAASRVEPLPPVDPMNPSLPPSQSAVQVRRKQPDPEQGLSSVRPGHSASRVYDPDAALSVAALLAKEMEQERSQSGRAMWASERAASRPGGTPEPARPAIPVLRRTLSMTSVGSASADTVSAATVSYEVEAAAMKRRSLPRNNAYGGGLDAAGEFSEIDTKAALRRLYGAIEGRGMAAVKRGSNGKGRSRVMVRSRAKEGTIGWAHVLPPFSRKFVAASMLMSVGRSSRVVTLYFEGREPVLFETDRLTDALILEQGFVSLVQVHRGRY